MQRLHGVTTQLRRTGFFFSLQGYTPQADEYATEAGIALFKFTDVNGSIVAVNAPANDIIARWRAASERASTRNGDEKLAKLREANLQRIAEEQRREQVRQLPPPPPPTKPPRRRRRWFGRGRSGP